MPSTERRASAKTTTNVGDAGHGRWKDFFPEVAIMDFSRGSQKDLSSGSQQGEISFYPLESKRTTIFR